MKIYDWWTYFVWILGAPRPVALVPDLDPSAPITAPGAPPGARSWGPHIYRVDAAMKRFWAPLIVAPLGAPKIMRTDVIYGQAELVL